MTDCVLEPLLDIAGVAEYLGVPVETLREWRKNRTGPKGFRVGRHLRYRVVDVQAFVDEQLAAEEA